MRLDDLRARLNSVGKALGSLEAITSVKEKNRYKKRLTPVYFTQQFYWSATDGMAPLERTIQNNSDNCWLHSVAAYVKRTDSTANLLLGAWGYGGIFDFRANWVLNSSGVKYSNQNGVYSRSLGFPERDARMILSSRQRFVSGDSITVSVTPRMRTISGTTLTPVGLTLVFEGFRTEEMFEGLGHEEEG